MQILLELQLLKDDAYLGYSDRCRLLRKGRKGITLSCKKFPQRLQAEKAAASLVLNTVQTSKAASEGAGAVAACDRNSESESVYVSVVTNEMSHLSCFTDRWHSVAQSDMQSVMHEYQGGFPGSLPVGLPSKTDVVQMIPTE